MAYGEARGLSVQWLVGLDAGLPEARAVFVLGGMGVAPVAFANIAARLAGGTLEDDAIRTSAEDAVAQC